jgi:hypothetical protein
VASIASALVEAMAVAVMIALVGVVIIAVVANRSEPDPTGRRPQSVYFFIVSFVTITVAISGSAIIVASLLGLSASHPSSVGKVLVRLLLVSVLITAVSLLLLAVHLRRGLLLARADDSVLSPSRRIGQSYVSVVAFVAIMVVLVMAVVSIYLLFSIAAPGTFGSFGGRAWATRILIETLYLGVVAAYVLWRHSSLLSPKLAILGRTVSGPPSSGSAPPEGLPQFAPPAGP